MSSRRVSLTLEIQIEAELETDPFDGTVLARFDGGGLSVCVQAATRAEALFLLEEELEQVLRVAGP